MAQKLDVSAYGRSIAGICDATASDPPAKPTVKRLGERRRTVRCGVAFTGDSRTHASVYRL
jgi:hypothetical protein